MIKKLTKSPLTYVLAQIKISDISKVANFIPDLQESLRRAFPLFNKIDSQVLNFPTIGKPEYMNLVRWHFMDKESTTGILIGTDSITIHTSNYISFKNIMDVTENALNKFKEIAEPGLCTRIGLRYINLIYPPVNKYLKKELLGFCVKDNTNFENRYVTKLETMQKSAYGLIKIQSTHINNASKISFVPPDLIPTSNLLSFEHQQKELQTQEHVMLDIDHFSSDKKDDFEVKQILQQLDRLHNGIEIAFESAIMSEALKKWK